MSFKPAEIAAALADELAADPVYGVFAAECHPTGDALERSNAYGVWQARHARTTDYHQE